MDMGVGAILSGKRPTGESMNYRYVDDVDDWEEYAELETHVEITGSYELRVTKAKGSMPDGVVLIRDMGGDLYGFMVPVKSDNEADCANDCTTHTTCRLQAITDAASESFMWCFTHGQRRVQCEWATVLHQCSDVDDAVVVRASLLDTLTEEAKT